jgi:ComEC/Rec2-related protein
MQMRDALDGAVLEWPVGFSLETWLGGMRAAVVRELGRGLEQRPTAHALIASMVLGLRGDGLEQEQEWFRQTGTLHLFAVSGLNLAMLATFLMAVTRVCFLGPRVVPVVVAPVLVVYAAVTGGSASCVRALVMSLMGLLAVCVGRSPVTLNSLGAAALVLLVWDGNVLFRPAFQLSFWMVLALSWVSGTLGRQLRNWARPDVLLPRAYWSAWQNTRMRLWQPVADALAVSLGAWIAGLPAAVLLFHELAPVAILANLLLTPLAFGILALGFTALFASPLGRFSDNLSGATPLLNRMNGHCADAVLWGVRFCSALPGAHWVIGEPWREPPDFIVFDVGEGAAVMVRFGATAFLLDCAREEQVRTVLLPAFRLYGLGELAGLILSHGDVHHVGGGIFLMEQLAVRSVVLPAVGDRSTARRRVEDWLGRHAGTAVERVSAGWGRQIGPGHTLEVLYPPADLRAALSDDKGLVIRWVSPHGSLLYTADAGFPTELWLLRNCADRLAADVWVRGQHGREKTGLEDFVRAVSPRVIVAGVPGRRAPRGSQQGWADPWFREGRTVFLQKDSGAVEGFWNGKRWDVRGFCSGPVRATPPEEAEGPGPHGERP